MRLFRSIILLVLLAALVLPAAAIQAQGIAPDETAEDIRAALFNAQMALGDDPALAGQQLTQAESAYSGAFAAAIKTASPESDQRIRDGFAAASQALTQKDAAAFAVARAQVWTSILAGSYNIVEKALKSKDSAQAQTWLAVREYRTVTRFSRPSAGATMAVAGFAKGQNTLNDTLLSLRADLLDNYQARLNESLRDLTEADGNGFSIRRAELAGLAQGYFLILAPTYSEQRNAASLETAKTAFAGLSNSAVSGKDVTAALKQVNDSLHNFRAAPLSPEEQTRRAGQLIRYLSLVPVEYERGVADGKVMRDLEIQEATTFHAGAYAAFSDLESLLDARDPAKVAQARSMFDNIGNHLTDAGKQTNVVAPEEIRNQVTALTGLLQEVIPTEWAKNSTQGDFDVIASMLDQMENAVRRGDYELAESARLEAYAVMETGPEARLIVFAPQLKLQLEELFWNGQGKEKGLAYLIKSEAGIKEVQTSRTALNAALSEAQTTLGKSSEPAAIATNAGLIVFREGLEAVLILASLMSSMKREEEKKYRKPMWLGTIAALLATVATWMLARSVLQSLARYGERLEAIVSLIAIAILLVILNWFFHKKYWTGWIASFHSKKRKIITGEAGLWLGLIMLGFTSVYREGFETVLFLQALVLEGGTTMVLLGVAAAMAAVVLVGIVTFKLQVNLPYRNMLIVTGVLIAGVLMQMVGNTVHVMQVLGWMPLHVIESISLPFWLGTWFGVYGTWEGLILQTIATVYVIGSYYMAEWMQKRNHLANVSPKASMPTQQPVPVYQESNS